MDMNSPQLLECLLAHPSHAYKPVHFDQGRHAISAGVDGSVVVEYVVHGLQQLHRSGERLWAHGVWHEGYVGLRA